MRILVLTLCAALWTGALAAANGESRPAPEGKAAPGGEDALCGTIRGLACAKGLWCDPEAGMCGGADIGGRCVTVPHFCTQEYLPVCGCDGRTYSNDCMRRSAKAQKRREGPC